MSDEIRVHINEEDEDDIWDSLFQPILITSRVDSLFAMLDMALWNPVIGLNTALRESMDANNPNMEKKNISLNISSEKFNSKFDNNQSSCSICFEKFVDNDDISILDCKHIFHNKCIVEWGCFKPSCPLCRKEIDHQINN